MPASSAPGRRSLRFWPPVATSTFWYPSSWPDARASVCAAGSIAVTESARRSTSWAAYQSAGRTYQSSRPCSDRRYSLVSGGRPNGMPGSRLTSTTGPVNPSSRRVAAAWPPVSPPPTITIGCVPVPSGVVMSASSGRFRSAGRLAGSWSGGGRTGGGIGGSRIGGSEASAPAEVLADEADGDRALADGGSYPLDRAAAHITGREHAGHAGVQQVGIAVQPGPGGLRKPAEVRPGDHEAVAVQSDGSGEPLGVRLGADENEQGRGVQRSPGRCGQVFDHDPLEPYGPVELPHRAVGQHLDAA